MQFSLKLLIIALIACAYSAHGDSSKINGISFVASPHPVNQSHIQPLLATSANYAAIMPFGFVATKRPSTIVFNSKRQWQGERIDGAARVIQQLQANKVRIMLKPQLWLKNGQYTGHMDLPNEQDWVSFETSYSDFILAYAQLAHEMQVDIFCIGTELDNFIAKRPDYWKQLIQQVKLIYKGKLTYAANWDEYQRTPFWPQLDYIGIDGYFPISNEKTPSTEAVIAGWQQWKIQFAELANTHEKQILFTEWGYRSADYTAKEPWNYTDKHTSVNLNAQANALEGTILSLWAEPWFAGGFVWKWFTDHHRAGGSNDNRFTPQNKPAEQVLSTYFSTQTTVQK